MKAASAFAGGDAVQQKRLTPAIIRELELAADILRRLPLPSYGKPARPTSSWPEIVKDTWQALAASQSARPSARAGMRLKPASPSPAEIDAMDRVLAWLWWLDPAQRRVVWARALKFSWRRLAATLACTTAQARYRHVMALRVLARHLCAQGFDVCALTQFGEAQSSWTAEDWAQARRSGIVWVLQAPLAARKSPSGKILSTSEDLASQVSQSPPYEIT